MRKQQLDGLRLLAFLLVFFFHACWRQGFLYGQFGTDLFFALSGFLITRLLLLNSGGSVLQEIRTFYARRTLRIFPVYYVYLAILFLNHRLNHAVWYVFYVFNFGFFIHKWRDCWGHLWTLSVEEQFYLFYPVLLLSTPPRWRLLTILILLASFEYCNSTLWDSQFRWYLLTPTRTALMWGALAGYIDVKCSQKWQKGGAIFAIGLAISAFFCYLSCWKVTLPCSFNALYYPWQPMAFALVVWGLWRAENKFLLAPFTLRPVAYLGKISYGLYLFHPTSYALVRSLSSLLPFLKLIEPISVALIFTIAQAMLSWHLLEKPMNDLKDRFKFTKPETKASATPGAPTSPEGAT